MLTATRCPATASGCWSSAPRAKSSSGICATSRNQPNSGFSGTNSPKGTRCDLRYVCVAALGNPDQNVAAVAACMRGEGVEIIPRHVVQEQRQRGFGQDDQTCVAGADKTVIG